MAPVLLTALAVTLAAYAVALVAVAPTEAGRGSLGSRREQLADANPLPRAGLDGAGERCRSPVGWQRSLWLAAAALISAVGTAKEGFGRN